MKTPRTISEAYAEWGELAHQLQSEKFRIEYVQIFLLFSHRTRASHFTTSKPSQVEITEIYTMGDRTLTCLQFCF